MSTPNDLQAFFSNIRPSTSRSVSEQATNPSPYFNSSSPSQSQSFDPNRTVSRPTNGSQSHSPLLMNTNSSFEGSQAKDDRTSNLLNLLKFSQPQAASPNPTPNPAPFRSASFQSPQESSTSSVNQNHIYHAREISASDLVASFMSKPSSTPSTSNTQRAMTPPAATSGGSRKASAQDDPQNILLRLLNRQKDSPTTPKTEPQAQENKPPVERAPEAVTDDLKQDMVDAAAQNVHPAPNSSNRSSPVPRVFGNERQSSSFEPEVSIERERTPSKPVFTYVNPFDQLAASSPRNRTPKPEVASGRGSPAVEMLRRDTDGAKRKSKDSSPEPSLRRKLTPVGVKNRHGSTPVKFEPKTESVSNALDEVAEQVDKQVEDALAREEEEPDVPIKQEEHSRENSMDLIAEKLQEAAIEVKKELDKEENEGALEDIMPAHAAESIREIINDAANGDLVDENWVSADAEDSPSKEDEEESDPRVVKVYQFPIKPFVTISIVKLPDADIGFRDDGIVDIARLKKPFDQTDRALASATSEYIVYANVKTGGVRIVRQDDGVDRSLFKDIDDRVFNVSIPTTPYKTASSYSQAVLATGVSGTVYWAPIFHAQGDLFESNTMESEALIFPPSHAGDDPSTSAGQLKTRARKSTRHPDYFAIGRGKSIHIVFTLPAAAKKYRSAQGVMNTEQFLKDRSLKITTGKAGKDFTFSEDDTVVVSLDKNGKVKFWDIRDLVEGPNPTAPKVEPVNVDTPILTLSSAATSKEKPWPTSVMLLDKFRPYARGTALRYMIVGLKQNHTLQLWDLALGKPVQELNLPHSGDADAICSFGYDPVTGILAIGHPTRNSIFLVHLSAPRYTLKPMCEADYLQRVVKKNPKIPPPESTAFLSGMREISFAPKGQLRSLELLPVNRKSASNAGTDSTQDTSVLFELYVMHSRGVTCLKIQNQDCGWSDDSSSRIMNPVDAAEKGVVELTELRNLQEESASGLDTPAPTPGKVTLTVRDKKKQSESEEALNPPAPAPAPAESSQSLSNGQVKSLDDGQQAASSTDKSEKKRKGRNKANKTTTPDIPKASESSGAAPSQGPLPQPPTIETSISTADAPEPPIQPSASKGITPNDPLDTSKVMDPTKPAFVPSTPTKSGRSGGGETINLGISGDFLDKEIKKIEKGVAAEMAKVIHRELDVLHRRLADDKRVDEAKDTAKTEAVLRLVSSTLNENVEKSLSHTISDQMQRFVVPAMQTVTKQVIESHIAKVVERTVGNAFAQHLGVWMSREMHTHLPNAVASSFHNSDVQRLIGDAAANKIATHVFPELNRLSAKTGNLDAKIVDLDGRQSAKAANMDAGINAKMDQMNTLLRGITETVHTMATAQSAFQAEFLKTQKLDSAASRETTQSPTIRSPPLVKTAEEIELEEISQLMTEGQFQEGTIKWLRSDRTIDLFDEFFAQCSPSYISNLPSIIALSVGVVVSQTFDTNTAERLHWLETMITTVNFHDPEIQEIAPDIMEKLVGRLESFYMKVAENDPQNAILRKIPPLTRRAREIKATAVRLAASNK